MDKSCSGKSGRLYMIASMVLIPSFGNLIILNKLFFLTIQGMPQCEECNICFGPIRIRGRNSAGVFRTSV